MVSQSEVVYYEVVGCNVILVLLGLKSVNKYGVSVKMIGRSGFIDYRCEIGWVSDQCCPCRYLRSIQPKCAFF